MTTIGNFSVFRILDFLRSSNGLEIVDLSSDLDLDTRIGSLICSIVDLVKEFLLVCIVRILFNGLDVADVSLDSDGKRIGVLVGSTMDLVLNLSLICFVRILFKVRCINPGIGR